MPPVKKTVKKAAPRKRAVKQKIDPALVEEERTSVLMIPVKTYGTLDQLEHAIHSTVQVIAVANHSHVRAITPDGREIVYNAKGNLVSAE